MNDDNMDMPLVNKDIEINNDVKDANIVLSQEEQMQEFEQILKCFDNLSE